MSPEHRRLVLTADEREMLEHSILARHARGAIRKPRAAALTPPPPACGSSWRTEVMFFGTLFLALGVYRYLYGEAFEKASERLNWQIGGINTLVLLVSSLTMVLAVHYAQHGRAQGDRRSAWRATAAVGPDVLVTQGARVLHRLSREPDSRLEVRSARMDRQRKGCRREQVPHVQLFLVFYWVMTLFHALARDDRHRGGADHHDLGGPRPFFARLLLAGRRRWRCIGTSSTSCGFSCCRCCTCWARTRTLDLEPCRWNLSLAFARHTARARGLVVLTFVTVGVSFIKLTPGWHLTFGLLIGLVKASLVVLFFMHLIHSPRLSWLIVFLALVWLLLLFALTFADYLSRGMVPYMPGH